MTIPKLTPYTGQVANPDGSQTQTEFTQNMFGQLSYEAQLATELDATIDGMNNAVDEVEANAVSAQNSANAADAAASAAGYQGLWPDTGGIADKGDTYQTQVGGTPTGEYFTALQNTSVDPVGDNVNWKVNISASNVRNPNLLSNGQFKIASPDDSLPAPSTTPQDYPAGFEIFSGWFADDVNGASGVTRVNDIINWTQDGVSSIYTLAPKDGDLAEYTASLAGKVAGEITAPDNSHVSFSDNGDGNWRITIANSATDIYSCKFEQGSVATGHEVKSLFDIYGDPRITGEYNIALFESLQDALDKVPSGGVLRLNGEKINITSDQVRNSPITILGMDKSKDHIYWDEGQFIIGLDFDSGNVKIRDVKIGTNYIRPSGKPSGVITGYGIRVKKGAYSNFDFEWCDFSGVSTGIITLDGAKSIRVNLCSFANAHHGTTSTTGGYGIVFQASQDTVISNCVFEKSINRRGVYLSTWSTPTQESLNHKVINNQFYGRTGGSSDYPTGFEIHVKIRASSDVVVSGNTFDGGLGGIFGEQSDEHTIGNFPRNVSITGNTFRNFNAFGPNEAVVTCMNRDARMYGWSVTGNTVKDCACRFMITSRMEDLTITGNSVELISGELDTYHTIEAIAGLEISNATITGNVFKNRSVSSNFIKMWMSSASSPNAISDLLVSSNVIECTGYSACDIRGYAGSVVGINFSANTIRGFGSGSALQVSTDEEVEIVFDGNICKSSEVNDRDVQVTSADRGSVRIGSVGGTIAVPNGVLMFSQNKRTGAREFVSNNEPTFGDYIVGDTFYKSTPSSGGKIGMVCTTAGVGGSTAVFKEFGTIS